MAKSFDELLVYQKAVAAADAISAMLDRRGLSKYSELRSQLADASAAIPTHISEGFGQKTDRHFAHYLFLAKGESNEIRTHLKIAAGRKCISEDELLRHSQQYEEIAKMLTGLIKHLLRENRKLRV